MDSAELIQLFNMFDHNSDGRISQEELTDLMEKLGIPVPAEVLAEMITAVDGDGDGCLDMEEFGRLYAAIMEGREKGGGGGGGSDEVDMREAFKLFDKDGDGFITAEELKVVLTTLGLKEGRSIEDCRRMISSFDVDNDGRVNFEEFLQMMKK